MTETMPAAVGAVGLGAMGAPMVRNLIAAAPGVRVLLYGRTPARLAALRDAGATVVDQPRDLGAAEVILVVLPDLPDLEELLDGPDGLLAGITGHAVLVVCSTVSPDGVQALGERVGIATDGRVRVVDAPVSGGVDGAVAGTLSIMCGGTEDAVATVAPVLATMGNPVRLGPLGAGQTAKACNQMIVAATVLALGEAAVIAERSGLDLARLFELLAGGYAGSRLLATRGVRFVEHDHRPSGAARYMAKDLAFAASAASNSGTTTRLLPALRSAFDDLVEQGFGDDDIAVVQAYIENLGVPRGDGSRRDATGEPASL